MGFAKGDIVNTAYGCGYVQEARAKDYVVRLKCWNLAQGQSPTLYLTEEGLSPLKAKAFPGNTVSTFCGPAKVLSLRNDQYVCAPTVWKLADYSPDIYLYLNEESITVIDEP